MAPPKKTNLVNTGGLTYEESLKAIKALKGGRSYIGEEITEHLSVGRLRTNIPTLDYMSGGGITKGRITIFGGKTGSAKTTGALLVVKAMLEEIAASGQHKYVLWNDAEGAYDPAYARLLGITPELTKYLIVKRVKVLEDAFKEADDLATSGFLYGLIEDSLDAMVSKKQDDNAYANTMGGMAGAMSNHLPLLFNKLVDNDVTTIFIKQARVKMGAYSSSGQEIITISGGYALRHFADSIFMWNRKSSRDFTYQPIGLKADKTRSSRMGLTLDIPLGTAGVDIIRDAFSLAKAHGTDIVHVAGGGWTTLFDADGNAMQKVQGEEKALDILREDKELCQIFVDRVYNDIINTSVICEGTEAVEIYEEDSIKKDE